MKSYISHHTEAIKVINNIIADLPGNQVHLKTTNPATKSWHIGYLYCKSMYNCPTNRICVKQLLILTSGIMVPLR